MSHANRPVLIVEDNRILREMLIEGLEDAGFVIASATDGQDAWRQLEQGLRPFLILLDLIMPRMDGWQFRARQQADPTLARIPVVIITADRDGANAAKCLQVRNWLSKPFQLEQVIHIVQGYYALSQSTITDKI